MKRPQLTLAAAALMLVAGVYLWGTRQGEARAQEEARGKGKKATEQRKLSTSGTATLRVKADSARVFFRVETYAAQVKPARAENGSKTKRILDSVKALKIPNLKAKSDDVNVSLVLDQNRTRAGELPKVLGYHVSATFTVLVENDDSVKLAESAAKLLDTALENGATGVDRIVFFKKDSVELRRQVLTKAVKDALANARAMARGADEKIIDAVTMSDEPRYQFTTNPIMTNSMQVAVAQGNDDAATPLMAGDLVVTCHVNVTCRY